MSGRSSSNTDDVPHQRFNIGGIHTAVYNLPAALASDLPVMVLITTHGRFGHQFDKTTKKFIKASLRKLDELEKQSGVRRKRELVIVTLVRLMSTSCGIN
jgi:glycogen synthase